MRVSVRALAVGLALVLAYGLVVLIGLIPVNNDFSQPVGGVEIRITSSAVHADLVLPIETPTVDWRDHFTQSAFQGDVSRATHIAIGWGDMGFYLEVPTWDDLTLRVAARAILVPSPSCVHVVMSGPPQPHPDTRALRITEAQYSLLVAFILAALDSTTEGYVQVPGASYGNHDAFFRARGRYHGLNTCNSWIGRGLREAGVRTPLLTPLPKSVFLYLPD